MVEGPSLAGSWPSTCTTFDAGLREPALEAGFLAAAEGGLVEATLDVGLAVVALEAGLVVVALDSGLLAGTTLEAGLVVAFDEGLAFLGSEGFSALSSPLASTSFSEAVRFLPLVDLG